MKKVWVAVFGLLVIGLLLSLYGCSSTSVEPVLAEGRTQNGVNLWATSGVTVEFVTQNDKTVDGVLPVTRQIPHLVLYRNADLTSVQERTLIVSVVGFEVPASGMTISLDIETQDSDPDSDGQIAHRIPVWHGEKKIASTSEEAQNSAAQFTVEFGSMVNSNTGVVTTPTGYYRYQVTLTGVEDGSSPVLIEEDYAFLMENQVVIPLPQVREHSEDAAPDALVIYYYDMVPFQNQTPDGTDRLLRLEVPGFVQTQLVPQMLQAFQTQTDDWGFPWYEAWTSYLGGADAERLSVSLGDGQTWFHSQSPRGGHAGIHLNVRESLGGATYPNLIARLMATFHHELFHNLQRNIALHYGGHSDLDGKDSAWAFIAEGTAVLASTIGDQDAEFDRLATAGMYFDYVNWFLGKGGVKDGLNTSYAKIDPYAMAIYWRFLYEQCGGLQVIREMLVHLYAGEIVDVGTSTDIDGNLPAIMGRALAGASCSFTTYRESMGEFSRALYGLNIDGGRCLSVGQTGVCGLYDPRSMYSVPLAGLITFTGTTLVYDTVNQPSPVGISSSFGIDFIEIDLLEMPSGQRLTLEFAGDVLRVAEFSVQVWPLALADGRAVSIDVPVTLSVDSDGHFRYIFAAEGSASVQRLAVIVTRVDASADIDPVGAYSFVLHTE